MARHYKGRADKASVTSQKPTPQRPRSFCVAPEPQEPRAQPRIILTNLHMLQRQMVLIGRFLRLRARRRQHLGCHQGRTRRQGHITKSDDGNASMPHDREGQPNMASDSSNAGANPWLGEKGRRRVLTLVLAFSGWPSCKNVGAPSRCMCRREKWNFLVTRRDSCPS